MRKLKENDKDKKNKNKKNKKNNKGSKNKKKNAEREKEKNEKCMHCEKKVHAEKNCWHKYSNKMSKEVKKKQDTNMKIFNLNENHQYNKDTLTLTAIESPLTEITFIANETF